MTQKIRLLGALRFGRVNPRFAWEALGIYRLSAVIHTLRKEGHEIITHDLKVTNQFGEECTVAEYELVNHNPFTEL